VFRFVPPSTSKPPQVGSGGYLHHQDARGRWGSERPRGWSRPNWGRRIHSSMEVNEYEPVTSSTVMSRFGRFTPQDRTTFTPDFGEHAAAAGDRYAGPCGDPVVTAADEGELPRSRPPHGAGSGYGQPLSLDILYDRSCASSQNSDCGGHRRASLWRSALPTPSHRLSWDSGLASRRSVNEGGPCGDLTGRLAGAEHRRMPVSAAAMRYAPTSRRCSAGGRPQICAPLRARREPRRQRGTTRPFHANRSPGRLGSDRPCSRRADAPVRLPPQMDVT
jgi:hypothetical protein